MALSNLNPPFGYISDMKNEHKERKIPKVTIDIESYITEYMQEHKRIIADLRDKGIMKKHEGKLPVTFQTYNELSTAALFAASDATPYSV